MELQAISGAATVALTSTIVFLLVAKTWSALDRTIGATPNFPERIMREAAQRFRDELERLSSSQSIYLGGALVFIVLFFSAYELDAGHIFAGYPHWQLALQLAFISFVVLFSAYCLMRTVLARRYVQFERDANIAIGHQLQRLAVDGTRVYHDVDTTAGVVDHVIVGRFGLYAVNVVAKRARRRSAVLLSNDAVLFPYDGGAERSIQEIVAKNDTLQDELGQLLGRPLRLRSVIAIPGWDIEGQPGEAHLLVNELTIAMFSGWKCRSELKFCRKR